MTVIDADQSGMLLTNRRDRVGTVLNKHFFKVYVIPGCVFQSVMVGGGYGTGREVVEYFTRFGFYGGIMGPVSYTHLTLPTTDSV